MSEKKEEKKEDDHLRMDNSFFIATFIAGAFCDIWMSHVVVRIMQ